MSCGCVIHSSRHSVEDDAELTFETLVTVVAGVTSLPDQQRSLTQPSVPLGKSSTASGRPRRTVVALVLR